MVYGRSFLQLVKSPCWSREKVWGGRSSRKEPPCPHGNPHTTTIPPVTRGLANRTERDLQQQLKGGGGESGVKEWSFTWVFLLLIFLFSPLPGRWGVNERLGGAWLPAGATPLLMLITVAAASKSALSDLRANCHQIHSPIVYSCPFPWAEARCHWGQRPVTWSSWHYQKIRWTFCQIGWLCLCRREGRKQFNDWFMPMQVEDAVEGSHPLPFPPDYLISIFLINIYMFLLNIWSIFKTNKSLNVINTSKEIVYF